MGEEWVPTKVADLKPGDEVRHNGTITSARLVTTWPDSVHLMLGTLSTYWPAHATVDVRVRRPVETKVQPSYGNELAFEQWTKRWVYRVQIGEEEVAIFRTARHAECYAEKLRNRPDLRAEALGQS